MNLGSIIAGMENILSPARQAAMRSPYTRPVLASAVNLALMDLGETAQENIALSTVALQVDYTLPAGVVNVARVEVATNAIAPLDYVINYRWRDNGAGHLIFDTAPLPAARLMKISYNALHASVSADADTISSYINPMRLIWAAVYFASLRQLQDAINDGGLKEFVGQALNQKTLMEQRWPVITLPRDPHMAGY